MSTTYNYYQLKKLKALEKKLAAKVANHKYYLAHRKSIIERVQAWREAHPRKYKAYNISYGRKYRAKQKAYASK
jgi:hypothetical protein